MRFDVATVVGLLAFATNLWGNVLVMRKDANGWAVRTLSIVLWGIYGIGDMSLPNLLNSICFFVLNVYAWRKWLREQGAPKLCPHCQMVLA